MAVAGRVAIVPKGDYVANKAYKRLDCVMYNGLTMYIAKKDVPVGTLPTDENYWMKSISTNSTGGLSKKIVEELPTTGIDESTIYLIRKITPGENDVYNEYMYIDGKWELIGNTAVDLSDYYTQEQIDTKINTINTELGEKLTSTSDISNTVVETLDATPSTRTLPKTGDKIKTIIAKTIKYFNDLKTIAFTGNASDLQDLDTFLSTSLLATEAGKRALDEAVGKVLNDKIEAILTKQGTTDISSIGNGTITGAISTLNSDKALSNLIKPYKNPAYIVDDAGSFIFSNLYINQGDIIFMSGTCTSPYGSFGVSLFMGNYNGISTNVVSTNNIAKDNVKLFSESAYGGKLKLRLTAQGTKPSDDSLSDIYIVRICPRAYFVS